MSEAAAIETRPMLVGGEWVESANGESIEVENPGRRTIIGRVPRGGAEDVDRAVAAAAAALAEWRRMAARERGRILLDIAAAIEERADELGRLIAMETGNALRTQARPEAGLAADIFRYFGGLASEIKGECLPLGENLLSYSRREPLGVVGAIIPWNAPVGLGAMKIAPALCTGNTLVLKAAEDAPLGVLMIAEICQRFLPPSVLNVLTGYGEEAGAALSRHPTVRKLSFTGSTEVGKLIMRTASERLAPVSLELGGKSPSIVYPGRGCGGLGGGRHRHGDALHPPEPVLHRRVPPLSARGHLRCLPRTSGGANLRRSRSAIPSTKPRTWARSSTGPSSTRYAATWRRGWIAPTPAW